MINIRFNKYKVISHLVLITFFLLTTIQTLFDVEIYFKISLPIYAFFGFIAASIIPIVFLLFIMGGTKNKTRYYNLFVIKEIRSIIKTLFYISLFSVFSLWSLCLIFIVGTYFQGTMILSHFSTFVFSKFLTALIYAAIVTMFFNGVSDIEYGINKSGGNDEV